MGDIMLCKALELNSKRGRTHNEPRICEAKSLRRRILGYGIAVAAALAMTAPAARAASNYVPPIVTTANTTLYSSSTSISPGRVAVDKAGNVFYLATGGASATLMEIPAASPAVTNTAPITLITGIGQFNAASAFVDVNGNLWVSDGNGTASPAAGGTDYLALVEIPGVGGIPNTAAIPSGGESINTVDATHCSATTTTPCTWPNYQLNSPGSSPINGPQVADLYVDGSGNVYYVDIYDNTTTGTTTVLAKVNLLTGGTATVLASGLPHDYNSQITVDAAGNVFYLDAGTGVVSQVSGGTLTAVGTSATIASAQITGATGISTDSYGNLYIANGAQLSEVPFEGTALNFADEFGIVNGLSATTTNSISSGGGVDANGNYYYAYNSGSATKIQQLQINGYNFGSVNVGTLVTGPSLTLYFNAAESSVSSYFPTGSPTTNSNGAFLQSFPYSGTKSFSGGTSFTAGQTGTITMDFQPIHPGLLKGSFTPRSNGANDTIVNLQGVGVGPKPMFLPGIASSLFTAAATSSTVSTPVNLNGPTGLAVDTYGDVFVADTGNGKVVADCLATTTASVAGASGAPNSFCGNTGYLGAVVELSTGFTKPAAIALDGANNLYVLDSTTGSVTEIQGVNLTSSTLVASGTDFGSTALSSPKGIAVDGYTNVYIADSSNNRIVKAHQFGATTTDNSVYVTAATTFGGTALLNPTGLGLDTAGDLFIADTGNNRIVEVTPLGVTSVVTTTGVTLNTPTAVRVLPSGTLVVTDTANGVSLIADGTGTTLPIGTLTPNAPQGVALDLAGNIYVADTGGNRVLELAVSSPAAVAFPSTGQGSTTSANTTSISNSGNATLTFSAAPTIDAGDTNFGVVSGGTCVSGSTVAPGAGCTVLTDFTPQTTGGLLGTVTLTDNQLGFTLNTSTPNETATFGTTGTQAIALSGTGTASSLLPQTITFTPPTSPVVYGVGPITLSATATSGGPVTFSVVSGPGSISGNMLTITATGTVVVAANQAGTSTYAAASQVTQSIVSNPAPTTKPAIVISQLSFLGAINGGGFLAGESPTGGSFAVNQQGNVIVGNTYGSAIYLYNGTTGAVTTLSPASGFSNPGGVAIDSNNNLYISHLYSSLIYKIPYVNGAYVPITDPSGSPYPPACTGTDTVECQFATPASGNARAMAFDSAGNFYMVTTPNSTTGASAIYECSAASCLPNGTGTLIYSDANAVGSIAIDPWGNLFFTDAAFPSGTGNLESTSSALNELTYTAGTGFAATPIVLETYTDATPANYDDTLGAVGTDANGTVYYATQYNGMYALANNHGAVTAGNFYGISPQGGKGLTLDASGNIYIVAQNNGTDSVGKILVNNIVAPSTSIGTSSTATNVTVMDNYVGCSSSPTIVFTSSTSEFSGTTTGTCAGQASGSDFAATITFTPSGSGTRTATLTAADTTNGGVGTAIVTGSVPTNPQTITFTAPTTPVIFGVAPIALSATASSGLPVTFSVLSGPGTVSGNMLTVTGVGTIVVAADQSGNASFTAAPEVTQSIVVNPGSQTITFTAPATPIAYTSTPITLVATSSSALPVTFSVLSGPATVSGSALTITGIGTIVVAADSAATANYTAAAEVTQSIVVNQAAQAISFTATSPITYSATPIALTATGGGSGNPVSLSVVSGPGTISGNMLTLTGIGTVVVAANQTGNANYTAAPQVTQNIVVNPNGTAATPTFTPAGGNYTAAQSVTIADTTPGAAIYYTTDGTIPAITSNKYTGAISVTATETIQALAVATGYNNSAIGSATYTLNLMPPNFTLTLNPTSLTVASGSEATASLTVTPQNGFVATVSFACSGLPSGTTCTFTPATATPTAGAATVAFTITAPASSAAVRYDSKPFLPGATLAAVALCFLGWRKRRRLPVLLLLAVSAFGLTMVSGCGTSAPAATMSNVTVTATSGSLTQTATLALTVQ
jgi:sugar lactone lactonase YvrE